MEKEESCEQNNNRQSERKWETEIGSSVQSEVDWKTRKGNKMNAGALRVADMSQCMKDTMQSMLRQANSPSSYIMHSVLFLSLSKGGFCWACMLFFSTTELHIYTHHHICTWILPTVTFDAVQIRWRFCDKRFSQRSVCSKCWGRLLPVTFTFPYQISPTESAFYCQCILILAYMKTGKVCTCRVRWKHVFTLQVCTVMIKI